MVKPMFDVVFFLVSGIDVTTSYLIIYLIMFVNIIFCLHRCYDANCVVLISEFTDLPHVHRCYGARHYNPCLHRCYGAGSLFVNF